MNQLRSVALGVVFVAAALLACKKEDSGGAGSSCASDADCKNGFLCESGSCIGKEAAEKIRALAAAPTEAPEAPAGGTEPAPDESPSAAKAEDEGPIPEIPEGRSTPPSVAEWAQAKIVNTQNPNSWPPDCTTKIVREWLQVNCTGKILGYEKMENFGKEQVDYFESIRQNEIASFVVRLKKGKTMAVRICRQGERASLFVNWPGAKDRPVHVALGKGPACDGTNWGAFHKQ